MGKWLARRQSKLYTHQISEYFSFRLENKGPSDQKARQKDLEKF